MRCGTTQVLQRTGRGIAARDNGSVVDSRTLVVGAGGNESRTKDVKTSPCERADLEVEKCCPNRMSREASARSGE